MSLTWLAVKATRRNQQASWAPFATKAGSNEALNCKPKCSARRISACSPENFFESIFSLNLHAVLALKNGGNFW